VSRNVFKLALKILMLIVLIWIASTVDVRRLLDKHKRHQPLNPLMTSTNTGSLFGGGGLGAATQSSSLFGNPSGTPGLTGGTSFAKQSQAQQQPTSSSVFGQDQTQTNAPQSSSQATQPAFFNSLLERGKKRPISAIAQNGNFEELPSLQLGLDDIRRKARELGAGGSKEFQPHVPHSKA
jgi:nuclear pore complex protein Nup93